METEELFGIVLWTHEHTSITDSARSGISIRSQAAVRSHQTDQLCHVS